MEGGAGWPVQISSFCMFTTFGMVTKWGWRVELRGCIFFTKQQRVEMQIPGKCCRFRQANHRPQGP
jgi:hypothetical protein